MLSKDLLRLSRVLSFKINCTTVITESIEDNKPTAFACKGANCLLTADFKPSSFSANKVSPDFTNSVSLLYTISTALVPNKSELTDLAMECLGICTSSVNKNLTSTAYSPFTLVSVILLICPTLKPFTKRGLA